MVNRMPSINNFGSTSSAASRARAPLLSAGGRGNQGAYTTISRNAITPSGSGKEHSSSSRSTGSASGSSRKMQRGSFRRTMMFQKNKRNRSSNSTSGDANGAAASAKTTISESLSPTSVANANSNGRSANRFQNNRRAFRGSGRAVVPSSTVEEREAGADSPTFPRPNTSNATHIAESSSSAAVHPQRQSQSPKLSQVNGKGVAIKQGVEIPKGHIDNILRFYGGNNMSPASLDLYRDVLKVPPDASDREIRIAYFRRGREILGDNSGPSERTYEAAKAKAISLDQATKARFQAVSMAYEILSTPSWRETYLQQGGLVKQGPGTTSDETNSKLYNKSATKNQQTVDPFSSSPSTVAAAFPNSNSGDGRTPQRREPGTFPTKVPNPIDAAPVGIYKQTLTSQKLPTALRKSSFTGRDQNGNISPGRTRPSTQRASSSVRWKDHVEELVFANHPNEHASDDDSDSDDSDYDPKDEEHVFEDNNLPEEEKLRGSGTGAARNGRFPADPLPNLSFAGDSNARSTRDDNMNVNNDGSNSSRSRRRRKNKPRIVIDSDELESHLQRMDDEAEMHFVKDFWDNFEESMDGILSMVDSIGGGDSSKRATDRNTRKISSTAAPFPNVSSWLSTSINSSSVSQRQSHSKGSRDVADATIGRSLSHDVTISTETFAEEGNDDGFVKRSNSLPLTRSSPSTLDAVYPSPSPPNFNRLGSATGAVVSPDEKGATSSTTASDSRVSSPYKMISDSRTLQIIKSREESIQQARTRQATSPIVSSPMIVSPSPKSKSTKTSVKNNGGLRPPSTDLDTTMSMSVASTILSTSQRQQQFFRPISPTQSEASELVTSEILPVSSPSPSNPNNGLSGVNDGEESDRFELESRLSEMDSLDLTELDNPFRSGQIFSHGSVSDVPSNSNNFVSNGHKKKNGFKVSMMSTPEEEVLAGKDVTSSHDRVQTDKNSLWSGASRSGHSSEDVFAGVEEDAQPLQQFDLADSGKLKVQDISIERSVSHMSDLSGSVFSSRRENDDDGEALGFAAANPSAKNRAIESAAVTFDPSITTGASTVSTKKSFMNSTTERSQGSTYYSSYASSTRGGTNSAHSMESKEVPGFFEYFLAYSTAVMTECANLGASTGVAEYHQDFIGLFSNDTTIHTAEIREQPSSMRRVPSVSTKSTLSL